MAKIKDTTVRLKAGPDDGLKEGQFTAYASVFGNKDSYGDVVLPGAFTETLAEWEAKDSVIPLLFGHNMQDPDFNIGEVLEAKEDDTGLWTVNQLDLSNPKAVQVYKLIKGRRIDQMSFAYDVLEGAEAQKEREDGTKEWFYELRKLKLYEVSVVPIGANQETQILAAKAANQLGNALKGVGLTDTQKSALLPAYEALGALLGKHPGSEASPEGPSKGDPSPSKASQTGSVDSLAAELELLNLKGF